MTITFPNENTEYRKARQGLLAAETELRANVENVAALRRALPRGGAISEDYEITNTEGASLRLSGLFEDGKENLAIYSFMYSPDMDAPCPMCTAFLDSLNGAAGHISQRINLAVFIARPSQDGAAIIKQRGWNNLRLYSAADTNYNKKYHGESPDGRQLPMMNVFTKTEDGIHHFWGTELLYEDSDWHPRHIDMIWPLWNVFDLTPAGRGEDWFPSLD